MGGAVLIDSVDGTLARLVDIKRNAPKIDGGLMDNIIDFVTWTIAPLFWIYATMQLPLWVLMACTVASAFGFASTEAKTDDNFFRGFPSYWNIVVFYIYLLDLPGDFASAILLVFAVSIFLPVKFIYPSRTDRYQPITLALGILFFLQLLVLMYLFDETPPYFLYSTFIFPVYYFTLSFYLNMKSIETSS